MKRKIGAIIIFLIILVTGIFWFNPDYPLKEGMVIATFLPEEESMTEGYPFPGTRYPGKAKIMAFSMHNPESEPVLLTGDFYSARAPELSYDGRKMLFSAQKEPDDTWQIFIMDLNTLQAEQLTFSNDPCSDPVWLPDGRVVYAKLLDDNNTRSHHALFVAHPEDSGEQQLTFHPDEVGSPAVFSDGRIIFVNKPDEGAVAYAHNAAANSINAGNTNSVVDGTAGSAHLLAMRIDGTMTELFYKKSGSPVYFSRPWEGKDNRAFFIISGNEPGSGNNLVSVNMGHPLSSGNYLAENIPGTFLSLYPYKQDQLLVSYAPDDNEPYGIYLFDIETKKIGSKVSPQLLQPVFEPVVLEKRETPRRLPSRVDEKVAKGTLLCHDADRSMEVERKGVKGKTRTASVQVLGVDGFVGEVPVEQDGSFYIEIDADKPVRFQTLNEEGEILRGPSSWIWVRPNEKRSCIGCHEDHEMAPENKVPAALYNGMVQLPEGKKTAPVEYARK